MHRRDLQQDLLTLQRLTARRSVLQLLAAASLLPILGCGDDLGDVEADVGGSDASAGTCEAIPKETEGPYPGDGSNGKNALILSGIVRRDIRPGFAGASGIATGIPLTVNLTLQNSADGCGALAGYAVYLWHCDQNGKYSMYDLPSQNYLRGVQETDANGQVTFTTIFPACYSGRMPHIHFEIYPSLAKATGSANKLWTSQLALPLEVCKAVYATSGYSTSVANLSKTSFAQDMVFSDGTSLQMPSVSGDIDAGFVASLNVGVNG